MPTFDFKCEVCGNWGSAWREKDPPRFCSKKCQVIGMKGQTCKRGKYVITDEAHEQIKRVYQSGKMGDVKALAKRLDLPRWKISRHAQKNGWLKRTKKEPFWCDEEMKILKSNAIHGEEYIQKKLKKAGFRRTVNGIALKRKRMRLSNQYLDGYSATGLAMCLGVDGHFVSKAIKDGLLKAKRRKTNRTPQQGGDSFHIKENEVRKFVLDNVARIDLAKVDKFWFVDLVAGR